jgi:hypothetical protein
MKLMELVERRTFEQAVAAKLIEWERTRKELERIMGKAEPASRDRIHYRLEKLDAKYTAAISKLKELGLSSVGEPLRRSESPPPG